MHASPQGEMRVWPSGKAKASQAFIRGFESRHPLHTIARAAFGRLFPSVIGLIRGVHAISKIIDESACNFGILRCTIAKHFFAGL